MESKQKKVTRIVITGGPCGGKSTAMAWIQNVFTKKGYRVLVIPETATELITGGVAPWTCRTNYEYQRLQVHLQLEKEKIFDRAAQVMAEDKVLIVCDRAVCDNLAYMTHDEFVSILQENGTDEISARDSYDAVFHLVTAAKGAEAFYTKANNAARYESVEEATIIDDRLISAWIGHPHFKIIDNSTDFDSKIKKLIEEITLFLGESQTVRQERKFLIAYPDVNRLSSLPNCRRIAIIQSYLKSEGGEVNRLRMRGEDGAYTYYLTTRRPAGPGERIETERRLTQTEYLELLMLADPSLRPIRKTRYCMTYNNHYFKIDVYPFWSTQALAEVEVPDQDTPIDIPPEIRVIREVTGERDYLNWALAARVPEPDRI